jgi:hypothetical protein
MKTLLAIVLGLQARIAIADRYMCQVEINRRWDAAYPCSLEIGWDEQLLLRASVAFAGHKIEGALAQRYAASNPATIGAPKPGEIVLTNATLRLPAAQRREDDDLSVYGLDAVYTRLVPDRDGGSGASSWCTASRIGAARGRSGSRSASGRGRRGFRASCGDGGISRWIGRGPERQSLVM